jgi:hypothetical protein
MNERRPRAAILLAGVRVTFRELLVNAAVAYIAAVAALLLGPLGALACMLIGEATTVLLLYGLLLFSLQRPGIAVVTVTLLSAVQIFLLRAHVPAGLFWLVWSKQGMSWLAAHGL